jgi:hypothetical protein
MGWFWVSKTEMAMLRSDVAAPACDAIVQNSTAMKRERKITLAQRIQVL